MADDHPVPTTIPVPDYALIRLGGKAGQIELEVALRNIVNVLNAYIIRKGG